MMQYLIHEELKTIEFLTEGTVEEVTEILKSFKGYTVRFPVRESGLIPSTKTFGDICPCNPALGGSGICHCTMANQQVMDYTHTTEYLVDPIDIPAGIQAEAFGGSDSTIQ